MAFQFRYLIIPEIQKAEKSRVRGGREARGRGGGVINVEGAGLVGVGQACWGKGRGKGMLGP